ncbi:MAG: tetraacyldisaccharide 4'-kinase [Candidatus Cyclobacteriaceae bacterium M3_2C_046]
MNKLLQLLLSPFSGLYYLITRFRNHLFDIGYSRSFQFETNVISVGNLNVGGTGKSPMVEYLIELLFRQYRVATLSRGYGRKTRGFRIASTLDQAQTLGDEPYQFYLKYKDNLLVTVGEERAWAIPQILLENPETQVILLDDAFQHRPVKPSLSILLTSFQRPFFQDYLLPSGRLREARKGAERADLVVVTKCPPDLTGEDMEHWKTRIAKYSQKPLDIYFSGIKYQPPRPVSTSTEIAFHPQVILFAGIAQPDPLIEYVKNEFDLKQLFIFDDHHFYNQADLEKIKAAYDAVNSTEKSLLTTEKDMVKLLNLQADANFKRLPLFYLPIKMYFLKNGKEFDAKILDTIKSF